MGSGTPAALASGSGTTAALALGSGSGTPAAVALIATKPNPAAAPFRKPYAPYHAAPEPAPFPLSGPCGAGKRTAGAAAGMSPAASVPNQVPEAPRKPRTAQQDAKSRIIWSQAKASRPRTAAVPLTRLAAPLRALPRDAGATLVPLVTYSCLASPHRRFGFCFPGGAGKRPAGAAAGMLPATFLPNQVPEAPPRTGQQSARSRSQAKTPRPRKAAVPRARLAEWHGVKLHASEVSKTIMLRNIPKEIRSEDMIKLLDEHCSSVNRAAGAVIAAYDVIYLPMHFRKEVNFGYALINFTTSAAVNGLYYSLENCGWNEHFGSKKAIKIYQAKQHTGGKAELLQHLKKLMLKCDNDKFLPVKLSPPRDGVNVPPAPRHIGCRSRNRKKYSSSKAIGIDQATQQLQFCIKPWNGVSVSVQVDTAKMTVGSLIQSRYPIARDSNVEIRLRLRAGQPTKTFDEQFNMTLADMFHVVQLPPSVQKQGEAVPITSVKFFSYKSTCYLHELLKFVTGTHRDGHSFNGAFDSIDIIWLDGRVHILGAKVLFDEQSCRNDFYRLYEIFTAQFSPHGYPVYFTHLLEYLRTCPAGRFSNREALLGFVTNHPCLQHYTDRMKQIMLLDNMFPRLHRADQQVLGAALGIYKKWPEHLHGVPEMDRVYYHEYHVDALGNIVVNYLYTPTPKGGIHYSHNYMKHAENQVWTEELEAAYCVHFENFLPDMLQRMARHLYHLEWVTGLLADKRSKERRN